MDKPMIDDDAPPIEFSVEVWITCSNCGTWVLTDEQATIRRCPECGAAYQVQADIHVYRVGKA